MPAASPPSQPEDDDKSSARKALMALDAQRKALESEAEAIVSELRAEPEGGGAPMGIDTPLTDPEGFPRADIDVYRARTLRRRLNEIRTDHKDLMKRIDKGLVTVAAFNKCTTEEAAEREARLAPKPKPKIDPVTGKWVVMNWDGTVAGIQHGDERSFANLDDQAPSSATSALSSGTDAPNETPPFVPFAVVDGVAPDSPAEAAGLHEGDLIVQFGTANHLNHRELKAIAEMVPEAAGDRRDIPIIVLRRSKTSIDDDVVHGMEAGVRKEVSLSILPRPWGGRGLLGCHIKGYTDTVAAEYKEPR